MPLTEIQKRQYALLLQYIMDGYTINESIFPNVYIFSKTGHKINVLYLDRATINVYAGFELHQMTTQYAKSPL